LYYKKMLSYRHGFHAGNAADALKHMVLIFCLDYLGQKEKPYLCVDTHGGAGSYALGKGFGAQNREWEQGIARLLPLRRWAAPLPAMLARYLGLIGLEDLSFEDLSFKDNPAAGEAGYPVYPGSPELIRKLLRPQDRAVCFELHPEDFSSLKELLKGDSRFQIRQEDGFQGLKSLLPPPVRRACVLVDPSYEVKDDYLTLPAVLAESLRRFPGGLYMVWYPLLLKPPAARSGRKAGFFSGDGDFPETLFDVYKGNRCRVELYTAKKQAPPANSPRGMYGNGLVIFNPPWTLMEALEETLPLAASLLGKPGGWKLWWEEAEKRNH
jgi:23S rRNA (adenine2030-N6)-methyltransferase